MELTINEMKAVKNLLKKVTEDYCLLHKSELCKSEERWDIIKEEITELKLGYVLDDDKIQFYDKGKAVAYILHLDDLIKEHRWDWFDKRAMLICTIVSAMCAAFSVYITFFR